MPYRVRGNMPVKDQEMLVLKEIYNRHGASTLEDSNGAYPTIDDKAVAEAIVAELNTDTRTANINWTVDSV